MGLFDKKFCDVCGEKIGLLGNRKLEDGNLCKNCASKLSPWFTGRRHSALADIKNQLEDREENMERVTAFRTSKKLGNGFEKIYVDEANGDFAVCTESDWKKVNPDIIPISSVTNVETMDEEHRDERKYKNKEGKMVSYNPPQYDYSYDFYCTLSVEHPYIDEIKFKVNDSTIKKDSGSILIQSFKRKIQEQNDLCDEIRDFFMNRKQELKAAIPEMNVGYFTPVSGMDEISVTFMVSGEVPYRITDEQLYNMQMNISDFSSRLTEMIHVLFAELEQEKIPVTDMMEDHKIISDRFDSKLKAAAANWGIECYPALILATLTDKDKETLKQCARMEAMKRIAARTANPSAVNTNATVNVEWECPSCKAKNKGKFCEYCGTPRGNA